MSKIDRDLRKFVTSLLKYADKSTVFPTEFTANEISKIFNGWSAREFNLVHHGAGEGCCFPISPDRWRINIDRCKSLQGTFSTSRLGRWTLWIGIFALIAAIAIAVLF